MPWRVGYKDGSGEEYIVDRGAGKDGADKAIAALRWGCSCCKDLSPLKPEEHLRARMLAQAQEMFADFDAIATSNPPQGKTFKQWVRGIADRHRRAVYNP